MKKIILTLILVSLAVMATFVLTPRPYIVHWHANFALYIDGKQWDFSRPVYMEEVERCNVTQGVTPQDRIHLHDGKGDLVHVHMAASTWGDLFANLRFVVSPTLISNGIGDEYRNSGDKRIYFFLNGEPIENPINTSVKSTDRLLVWYGTGSVEEIRSKIAPTVSASAIEYNSKADPASCSTNLYGFLTPIVEPILERIHHHQ